MKLVDFVIKNKKYANISINIILVLYISIIIFKQENIIQHIKESYNIIYLIICLLLYGLSILSQIAVWVGLTIQSQENYIQYINNYIYANLASQVGNIWKYVTRILIYRNDHKSTNIIFFSLIEILLLLLSGSLLIVYLINITIHIKIVFMCIVIVILYLTYVVKLKVFTNEFNFIYWILFLLQLTFINWLGGGIIFYIIIRPFSELYNISLVNILIISCSTSFISVILQNVPLSSIFRNVVYFYYLDEYIMDVKISILALSILYISIQMMDLLYNWLILVVTNKLKHNQLNILS